jgi:PAS domain S-box-containing protein
LSPDGSYRLMLARATPVRDATGRIARVLATLVDIEDRVRAENQSSEQAEVLGTVLQNAALGLMLSLNRKVSWVNAHFCEMLGYQPEEIVGQETRILYPSQEEYIQRSKESMPALKAGGVATVQARLRRKDGSIIWVDSSHRYSEVATRSGQIISVVRDITAEREIRDALERSEQLYRLLADNQTDFVQLFDRDGRVLYDSPSIIRMFGDHYTADRRFGEGLSLIHPDDKTRLQREVAELARQGGEKLLEFCWALPDGDVRWVEAGFRTITDNTGQVVNLLEVARDITQRKQAELQREAALQQARIANEAKSQFLARVSHELRTPLNAVLGYGYLLGKTRLDAKQSAQLDQIVRSSQHLLGLISDVLDLSRIEAGEQSFTSAQFSLGELIDGAMAAVRPAADGRAIALRYENAPQLPDAWIGDARLIEQVLLNYLSNAVKFTERGSVTLRVREQAGAPGDDRLLLRVEVQDTGSGIAPDKLDGLFKAFSQVMPDKRGTGLGLEITRRLVELMGGEVGVQSRLGEGSCFWFTVPLQRVRQQATNASAPAIYDTSDDDALEQLRARHGGTKILMADDDLINQDLMEILLEQAGLVAQIADDGAQALEMARAAH